VGLSILIEIVSKRHPNIDVLINVHAIGAAGSRAFLITLGHDLAPYNMPLSALTLTHYGPSGVPRGISPACILRFHQTMRGVITTIGASHRRKTGSTVTLVTRTESRRQSFNNVRKSSDPASPPGPSRQPGTPSKTILPVLTPSAPLFSHGSDPILTSYAWERSSPPECLPSHSSCRQEEWLGRATSPMTIVFRTRPPARKAGLWLPSILSYNRIVLS
jgi:hypothetical protein